MIGAFAGVNIGIFNLPKHPSTYREWYDPKLRIGSTLGISYRHSFSKRFSHHFQLRYMQYRHEYGETRYHMGTVDHERITYKIDMGPTTLHYNAITMAYFFGWRIHKKSPICLYIGHNYGLVFRNFSERNVEVTTFGKYKFVSGGNNTYTTYDQPIITQEIIPENFLSDFVTEAMAKIDAEIKISKTSSLFPSIEYSFDYAQPYIPYEQRISFFLAFHSRI